MAWYDIFVDAYSAAKKTVSYIPGGSAFVNAVQDLGEAATKTATNALNSIAKGDFNSLATMTIDPSLLSKIMEAGFTNVTGFADTLSTTLLSATDPDKLAGMINSIEDTVSKNIVINLITDKLLTQIPPNLDTLNGLLKVPGYTITLASKLLSNPASAFDEFISHLPPPLDWLYDELIKQLLNPLISGITTILKPLIEAKLKVINPNIPLTSENIAIMMQAVTDELNKLDASDIASKMTSKSMDSIVNSLINSIAVALQKLDINSVVLKHADAVFPW
jgi:hypothetical protein